MCSYVSVLAFGSLFLIILQEFGDISATLYTGPILYTTVVKERYYGVLVTNMTVGDISIDLPCSEVFLWRFVHA